MGETDLTMEIWDVEWVAGSHDFGSKEMFLMIHRPKSIRIVEI